ncbi:MAG TPA: hypothetical protein VIW24_05595 [Aldersonia sp.]
MLVPLVAALARTGNVVRARVARQRAVDLARRLRDGRRLLAALTSWDAPVIWTLRVEARIDYAIVMPLRDALANDGNDRETRARLLTALVYELEGLDCEAASVAALQARTLARAAGDPRALCGALGAVGYIAYGPDLSAQRLSNAEELLRTATAHRFDDYRALAHFQLFLAHNAELDLAGAARHLGESLTLASGGQVGQLILVGMAYDALCNVLTGRLDAAQSAYERVTERMIREGTASAAAFGLVGAMSCAAARGNFGELVGPLSAVVPHWPVAIRIPLSLALFDAGDHEAARATWTKSAPYPRDYYWLPMTTLRAHVAARLRDSEACATIRRELEPFSGMIAGLESGSMYAGPVDSALAAMADVVGDRHVATRYRAAADDLTKRIVAQLR